MAAYFSADNNVGELGNWQQLAI